MNNLQIITAANILGLAAIAAITTTQASQNYVSWHQVERDKSELRLNANLEAQRAESSKDIADSYSANDVALFNQIIISDYILTPKASPPKLDWKRAVDPSKKTIVFDRNRRCVGYADSGTFYFTLYYRGVCYQ